jgi:hypothetical protein
MPRTGAITEKKCDAKAVAFGKNITSFMGEDMPNLTDVTFDKAVQLDHFVLENAASFVEFNELPAKYVRFDNCVSLKQIKIHQITHMLDCKKCPFLTVITGDPIKLGILAIKQCPFVYISPQLIPMVIKCVRTSEKETGRYISKSPSSGYKVRCWLQRARNLVSRKDKIAVEVLIKYAMPSVLLPIIFGYRF